MFGNRIIKPLLEEKSVVGFFPSDSQDDTDDIGGRLTEASAMSYEHQENGGFT